MDHFTWYFGFVIAGVWWSTDLSHKSSPTKTWCMSCKAYLYALQIGPVHFPSSGEMRTAEQLKEEYNHRDLQCNLLFFLGHFVSNCSSFVPAVAFLKKYQIWDTLLGVLKKMVQVVRQVPLCMDPPLLVQEVTYLRKVHYVVLIIHFKIELVTSLQLPIFSVIKSH